MMRRERSASDRRKQALHLTAPGLQALSDARASIREHEAWLKGRFSPQEVEKLVEMLARIHE
jgi:DNA-binding MarR family transcriptional regulator